MRPDRYRNRIVLERPSRTVTATTEDEDEDENEDDCGRVLTVAQAVFMMRSRLANPGDAGAVHPVGGSG